MWPYRLTSAKLIDVMKINNDFRIQKNRSTVLPKQKKKINTTELK